MEITFLRQAAFFERRCLSTVESNGNSRVMVSLNAAIVTHSLDRYFEGQGIQRTSQADFEHLPINRLKNQVLALASKPQNGNSLGEKPSDLDGLGPLDHPSALGVSHVQTNLFQMFRHVQTINHESIGSENRATPKTYGQL